MFNHGGTAIDKEVKWSFSVRRGRISKVGDEEKMVEWNEGHGFANRDSPI
jgi:hypothetical protein